MESLLWAFCRRSLPPHRRTTSQPAVDLQDLFRRKTLNRFAILFVVWCEHASFGPARAL